MPRKVILGFGISLDGYIARRNGALDFLAIDKEGESVMADFFSKIDTTIMGRKTAAGWAKMRESGEIPDTPGMTNYVVSRRWKPGKRGGLEVVSGTLKTFVRKLKRRPGKDIYLGGGGELARSFLQEDGGRALHRTWSTTVRRWHPRVSRQVSTARFHADRMQVLLEWIGRATL